MEIISIKKANKRKAVNFLAEKIREGKIIICPTDTVYGLLCDATSKKAIDKLFKIKKREKGKFFPIFVENLKTAERLAFINSPQEEIIKKSGREN